MQFYCCSLKTNFCNPCKIGLPKIEEFANFLYFLTKTVGELGN